MLQRALWLVLPVASISHQFFGSYIGFLLSTALYRVKFKILILTFKALHAKAPFYIRTMLHLTNLSECCGLSVPLLWKCLVPEV